MAKQIETQIYQSRDDIVQYIVHLTKSITSFLLIMELAKPVCQWLSKI